MDNFAHRFSKRRADDFLHFCLLFSRFSGFSTYLRSKTLVATGIAFPCRSLNNHSLGNVGRQQLRNADFGRFSTTTGFFETTWLHLKDELQTLGIHLVLGDWISSIPSESATIAGVVALVLLVACSLHLWQQKQRRLLTIALLLGIFPLFLGLVIDVVGGKFTVGFGWGRSRIFILPGCLLLFTIWIQKAAGKWQKPAAAILLFLYLSVSISDFTLRPRWMFHQMEAIIEQEQTTPTLIAMNSLAWGNVLRLAYYLPVDAPIMLLSRHPADLATSLEETLATNSYPRLIWLDSHSPVWAAPKTEAEKKQWQEEIVKILHSRYELEQTQQLSVTMDLDNFTAHIYHLQ